MCSSDFDSSGAFGAAKSFLYHLSPPRIRRLPWTAPDGAWECSHGWSAGDAQRARAQPVEMGEQSETCPGGVEESAPRRVGEYSAAPNPFAPTGARWSSKVPFHGLRSAENSLAPPVATTPRPVCAKLPDKMPHPRNHIPQRKPLQIGSVLKREPPTQPCD